MSTLHNRQFSNTATDVSFSNDYLTIVFDDGRDLSVPLYYFPKLENAPNKQSNNYGLICQGAAIHREDVDEDLSIAGLQRLPD
jgi:hypothetical protein